MDLADKPENNASNSLFYSLFSYWRQTGMSSLYAKKAGMFIAVVVE
jgi:hypothetical protein